MQDVILFGAGREGKKALWMMKSRGKNVVYFVDNDCKKWGKKICGIPVIGMDELKKLKQKYQLLLSVNKKNKIEIENELRRENIKTWSVIPRSDIEDFDRSRECLTSYSYLSDMEDVILYHVFRDVKEVFYIDVGCNEPVVGSVTKLLYDRGIAHGINIDPQPYVIKMMDRERQRDINLCCALGGNRGTMKLYVQGGLSTLVKENVVAHSSNVIESQVYTLQYIYETYVKSDVSFLKIDVEGFEKEVLLGADFKQFRPFLIVMESTLPMTDIPSYQEWESILTGNHYHMSYSYGVNRYYVADEHSEIDERFLKIKNINDLHLLYNIWQCNFQPFDIT